MFRVTYFFQTKAGGVNTTQMAKLTQRSPVVGEIPNKSRQPNYNIFGFPWWKIPDFHSINKLLTRSFIWESLTPIEQEDKMAIFSSRHIFTGHVLLGSNTAGIPKTPYFLYFPTFPYNLNPPYFSLFFMIFGQKKPYISLNIFSLAEPWSDNFEGMCM